MSASREKKARQERGADYVSPKQQKELEERKANRRSTAVFAVCALLIVGFAVFALLNNSGVLKRGAAAVTVNGETYTAEDVAYYYYNTRANLINNGYVSSSSSLRDQDYTSGGEYATWYDYVADQAIKTLAAVRATAQAAKSSGFTGNAEMEQTVSDTMDSLKSGAASSSYTLADYIKAIFNGLMTKSSFEKELRTAALADAYASSKSTPESYSESELQAAYDADPNAYSMVDYKAVIFLASNYATDAVEATETTEAVEADDGTEAAKAAAEHALAEYRKGNKDLEKLAEEAGLTYLNSTAQYGESDMLDWLFDNARREDQATVLDYSYYGYSMGSMLVVFEGKERADFHSVDVRHILVDDEDTAKDILAKYEAGEQTEDAFAALAQEYSTDNADEGGLYTGVYKGQMVEPFENWCFAAGRKTGDTGIVQTDYGYHVMYYVGCSDYAYWQESAATKLTSDWQASLTENMTVTQLDGMKYIDP